MSIKGEHIVFLLGAGASFDASIPISNKMVEKIENLILEKDEWQPFKELYYYLKSSIQYSEGIFGKFGESFNVEKLLIVITEIEKRDKNIMYPFIGAWNIRLLDLAGPNFENITHLQKLIRKQLNEWVRIKNYDEASYYEGFNSLHSSVGQLIKVFTLNYDLCFERVVGKLRTIETGFNKGTRDWHYSNFENSNDKHFFLYKLHGSIDWYIEDNKLFISDDPVESPELIFGIQHKMTSVDPYFYYSSELRKSCLNEAKLIIVIGYSFADEYVNKILTQALNSKENMKILCIEPTDKVEEKCKEIYEKLELKNKNQVFIAGYTAKQFITEIMNIDYLADFINEPQDIPFSEDDLFDDSVNEKFQIEANEAQLLVYNTNTDENSEPTKIPN